VLYSWLVYLHLVGVFGFLLAHGISISVAAGLRRERDPRAVALLLRLSSGMRRMMYGSLAVLLAGGIGAGVVGSWWGRGWIWTALVLLVVLLAVVVGGAVPHFRRLRLALNRALARKPDAGTGDEPGDAELGALLASPVPLIVAVAGGVVLLAILYLMVFKPF